MDFDAHDETCAYCGRDYAEPVSYHHDAAECASDTDRYGREPDGAKAAAIRDARVGAASSVGFQDGGKWRHVDTGERFTLITTGQLRDDTDTLNCQRVVIYRSDYTGRVWVRLVDEFLDGRFAPVEGA